MRVIHFNTQSSGVGFYRHWLPSQGLQEIGIESKHFETQQYIKDAFSTIAETEDNVERYLMTEVPKYDIMHVGYSTVLSHVNLFGALRNYASIPFIVDIDDDPYNVPPYNRSYQAYHSGAEERRVARMHLRVADAVSTSTLPLEDIVKQDANVTTHLPNCHKPWGEYETGPRKEGSVRIMFVGGTGRFGDINEIKEVLEHIIRKYDHVQLLFMGVVPDWADKWLQDTREPSNNRAFVIQHSNFFTYPKILKWLSPDIFMAPVVQNIFNRSKSHIKSFDAAECGAAFICTDWDTYGPVPNDCAIKVAGDYEWREGLEYLIENAEARVRLNGKLKDWVYSTQLIGQNITKWTDFYAKIISKGPIQSLDDIVRPGGPHGHSSEQCMVDGGTVSA